jgi:hypothetical protein
MAMRFRLGTLLGLVTALALFFGVVFAAPVWLTAMVLTGTMLLSPAVWLCGSSYASPSRQAFFRGGMICGIFPFVVACVVSLYVVPSVLVTGEIGGFMLPFYSVSTTTSNSFTVPTAVYAPIAAADSGTLTPQLSPYDSAPSDSANFSPTPSLNSAPTAYPDSPTYSNPPPAAPSLAMPVSVIESEATLEWQKQMSIRLLLAAVWLMPGCFAFCGGGLGYLTYRCVTPREATVAREPGHSALERQVVAGRLSTVVAGEEG